MPASTTAPMLDTSDLIILAALVAGGMYWLWNNQRSARKPGSGSDGLLRAASPISLASRSSTPGPDRSLADRFTRDDKDIVILFGSQTGTAEGYAARLAKEAQRYGLQSLVCDPDDLNVEELAQVAKDKLVIFVVATYGEGEPTDNAVSLVEWLRQQFEEHKAKQSDDRLLGNLNYAIFGLGNKTYEQFNSAARNIDRWCTSLGGTRLGSRGEGDDDGSLEDDFQEWKNAIWPDLAKFFNVDLDKAAIAHAASNLRTYALELNPDSWKSSKHIYKGELGDPKCTTYDAKNPFYAKILRTQELFSGEEKHRNCVHVEFDLTGSKFTYSPGDHLALWPQSNDVEVSKLAQVLKLEDKLDNLFSLNAIDLTARKRHPFPCPTSFRAAFKNYLDVGVAPKAHIFQSWIPHISENNQHRPFYVKLANDKEFYQNQVAKAHLTIASILLTYPAPEIPLDVILESFTRIQPRYYSISSSPRYLQQQGGSTSHVHITATVLRYEVPDIPHPRLVEGLATRYLHEIHCKLSADPNLEIRIPVSIRHAAFKLPRQLSTPVVMIGPGTGVAPFRGFVQERCAAIARMANVANGSAPVIGESILFFGCRYRRHDFLYHDEWEKYQQAGGLSDMQIAFSRDTEKKVYVQHKLAEKRDQIWAHVKRGGHIYVCGDAKNMAHDVNQWFIDTARDVDGLSEAKAQQFVKDLKNRGRYMEDVWS